MDLITFFATLIDQSGQGSADNHASVNTPATCVAVQQVATNPCGWIHRAYGFEGDQSVEGFGLLKLLLGLPATPYRFHGGDIQKSPWFLLLLRVA